MDRRSRFSRAAAQGLIATLSHLSLAACNQTQTSPTTPVAPMDPPVATPTTPQGARPLGVSPAPPPLRPGNLHTAPQATTHDRACCAGKNDCKGQGGCANDAHDCAGKNECKGTSTACAPGSPAAADPLASPKDCCKGKNQCKGKSDCKVPGHHACRGQNECKGKGWACKP